jgi:hypothetical protein
VHEEQNLSANQHTIGGIQSFSYGDFLVDFFTLFYRENALTFFFISVVERFLGGWVGCTLDAFRTPPPPFQAIEIEQREL